MSHCCRPTRYGDYNLCHGCGKIVNKSKLRCEKCQKEWNEEMELTSKEIIKNMTDKEREEFGDLMKKVKKKRNT